MHKRAMQQLPACRIGGDHAGGYCCACGAAA